MREYVVEIAGQEYALRYPPRARHDIEKYARRNDLGSNLLQTLANGSMEAQAAVIWGGLKETKKKLTVEQVIDMLSEHMEKTGSSYDAIFIEAVRALIECKLLGDVDEKALLRLIGYERFSAAAEESDEPGKAPTS